MMLDPVIVLIARFALGALFVAGAVDKLKDVGAFERALAGYRLVPETFERAAAWAIAAVEVPIGIGAFAQQPAALLAAVALLAVYAAAIGVNLVRGRRFIDCGCGGAAQPLSGGLVVRNVALIAVGMIALAAPSARSLSWVDAVTVIAGVFLCAAIYGAANQLLAARARLEEWI
jgi:methylamine utilization protein MauE